MPKTAIRSLVAWRRHRGVTKTLLAKKLIVIVLTAAFLNVSAGGLAQRITFSASGAPLEKVFSEVEKMTGYVFLYKEGLLTNAKPVFIKAKDLTLEDFLTKLLKGQSLAFRIADKTIFITRQIPAGEEYNNSDASTSIEVAGQAVVIPPIQIKIKVVDADGNPLSGATVINKNSKLSKVTAADGTLSLEANAGDVLEITYVGYERTTHKVAGNATSLLIKLKVAEKKLEEQVITGYSNIRKESFTGNSTNVTREQILKVANRNVIDVLQVYDPSFRLERNNIMGSDPNTKPEFYIRGRSGIGLKELDATDVSQAALSNNPNLPIFIMDGYEVSAEKVYDYDPNRIKSMTILKDAAATAIYGSRAANGVVVIETVPPLPGRLRVSYNVVGSLTLPDVSDYNLMNAAEKLEAERLAGYYDWDATTSPTTISSRLNEYLGKKNQIIKGVNTDWISLPLRNEYSHKHTLYVDGGNEEIRFGMLLRYDQQKGVMKGSDRERLGSGINLEYRRNKLQIRNDVTFDVVKARNSPYGNFADYVIKAPYNEIYDATGKMIDRYKIFHSGDGDQNNLGNPLYEATQMRNSNTSGYNALANNLAINLTVIPKVQIKAQFAISQQLDESEIIIDPNSTRYTITATTNYENIGELTVGSAKRFKWSSNVFANYVNRIHKNYFNFQVGVNTDESKLTSSTAKYTGFAAGVPQSPNVASKIAAKPAFSENTKRLWGSFASLNYTYNDVYLFDISGRLDGSSEFGSDKKYAPFWSTGIGVNLHKYSFVAAYDFISRLKLTANMGQTGKINFSPYAAKDNYIINQGGWYRTGSGTTLIAMGNPGLTWEKTNNYDVILDLGLFNNRVSFNFDWYNKITNDLVNDVDLPSSAGFVSYKDNIGKIQNKGYEVQFRADVIKAKDVLIGIYANLAHNKNKILSISQSLKNYNARVDKEYADYTAANAVNFRYLTRYTTPHLKYVEGGSLTSIFGMQSLGINPMDGKEIYVKRDGTITYDWNAADQVILGNTEPKAQGAFGVNASYKGFTFFASMLYQFGGQEYNYTLVSKVENVDIYNRNADRRVLTDRWKNPGDVTLLKDIKQSSWATRPTSRFVQNYNALTFNSISIGYNLQPKALKRMNLSMLRVQASTNKLATISSVPQERGLSYPFARTFDLSLSVGL